MQVANNAASAKELPSCEARPGRRVNNSAAGKLQGGELREDCVEGALERGLAGRERGVRGVRGQQRRVGLGPLERRDAGVTASKLRCDEGLGGETQQGICYFGVYLQRRVQPVHRGEQGGQRAGVRLAEEGGVQGRRGDGVQEGRCYLRVHHRGSVDGRLQGVRGQRAGVRLGGLQPREASLLASSEASAAAVTAPRRALATLVSTSSGVILAAMSREWPAWRCWPRLVL